MTFIMVVKMRTELDVDVWEPHNDAPVLRTKCSAHTPGPWTRLRMRVSSAGTSLGLQGLSSGGPLMRGSTSEDQDIQHPKCTARRMFPTPPLGSSQVWMQTPETGSGLGEQVMR